MAKTKPGEALPLLAKVLKDGTLVEKQGAFAILGDIQGKEADELLAQCSAVCS